MITENLDDKQKRLLQSMMKYTSTPISSIIPASPIGVVSGRETSNNQVVTGSTKKKTDTSETVTPVAQNPKSRTSEQTPKKSSKDSSTETHFSGSAFLSSPDPSQLPMPNFEEDFFSGIENTDNSAKSGSVANNSVQTKKKKSEKSLMTDPVAKIISSPPSYSEALKGGKISVDHTPENKADVLKKYLKLRKS